MEKYNTMDMYNNTDTIQMPYGEIQSATSFLSKQYNSWWKVQRSTLQFYSIGFSLNKEHTWRHIKLVAKQLQPDLSTMQMSYDTENDQ